MWLFSIMIFWFLHTFHFFLPNFKENPPHLELLLTDFQGLLMVFIRVWWYVYIPYVEIKCSLMEYWFVFVHKQFFSNHQFTRILNKFHKTCDPAPIDEQHWLIIRFMCFHIPDVLLHTDVYILFYLSNVLYHKWKVCENHVINISDWRIMYN